METFKIKTHVGSDGILKFEMPVGLKDVDAEVIVIYSVEAKSPEADQQAKRPAADWHQFLRETYGSLRDTPIQRWDQGEYEEREPLE